MPDALLDAEYPDYTGHCDLCDAETPNRHGVCDACLPTAVENLKRAVDLCLEAMEG
jgi:hypothetical protein